MTNLPDIPDGDIGLLIGTATEHDTMLTLTAQLALKHPVRVINADNQFNLYHFTRYLRHHTAQLDAVLSRIHVACAFTCYQVLTLFQETVQQIEINSAETAVSPLLIFDLLSTFSDENVPLAESLRLLQIIGGHLNSLRQNGSILISVRPPPQPERAALLNPLRTLADHIFYRETPTPPAQPHLF
mgnify:CR=1 FL=1